MAVDMTSSVFLTGKHGVTFDSTAVNGTEKIIIKDSSAQSIWLEYIQLACGSGASLALYDGSAGKEIIGTVACSSQTLFNQAWDFKEDPIQTGVDISAGGAVCISAAADGMVHGFIKYYKG